MVRDFQAQAREDNCQGTAIHPSSQVLVEKVVKVVEKAGCSF